MSTIKDHMDRGVQVSVENGILRISGPDGVIRLYADDWLALQEEASKLPLRMRAAADDTSPNRPDA